MLLVFPIPVLIGVLLLTAFTVNGNSSGFVRHRLETGRDPALVLGHPQSIRSDDWNVNAPLTIAQKADGLPERNRSLVGGQDAAVPQDLPRSDWSVVFRPHLWAFPITDLAHAVAWRWWAPAGACLVLAYLFGVTVLPSRPVVSALAAVGLVLSPFLQWWFQSVSFWPIAWGLAAITAMLWATRDGSRAGRWVWAGVAGFLTPVAAMGIYAPYLIPIVVVVAAAGVGTVVSLVRVAPGRITRLVPLAIAGALGAGVTVVWLRSKQNVVNSLVDTVYPGERLTDPGAGGALSAVRTLSSSFSEALSRNAGFLGLNSSEASTFFLLGAFALPMVLWLVVRRARIRAPQPVLLLAVSVVLVIFAAFVVVPGWEPVAHLLFLDRTTDTRIRIGLGFASFLVALLLARELPVTRLTRAGVVVAVASGAAFLLSQVAIAIAVIHVLGAGELAHAAPFWWLLAVISAAAVVLLCAGRALPALALFAVFSIATSFLVNPIYLGIYDMRGTAGSRQIRAIDARDPGRWVPLGGSTAIALVTESSVTSYAGIQGAPSRAMWHQLDPSGRYEQQWNRLANIGYEAAPGIGDPVIENPAPDQILVRFDPCGAFAQRHVSYVASDGAIPVSPCLREVKRFTVPRGSLAIFAVTRPT